MKRAFLVVLAVLAMAGCWDDDCNTIFEIEGDRIMASIDIAPSNTANAYWEAVAPPYPREQWDSPVEGSSLTNNNQESTELFVADYTLLRPGDDYHHTRRGWMEFDLSSIPREGVLSASFFFKNLGGYSAGLVMQASNQSFPIPAAGLMTDDIWMDFDGAAVGRADTIAEGEWNEVALNSVGVDYLNSAISDGTAVFCFRASNDYDSESYEESLSTGMYLVGSDYEPYLAITYNPFAQVSKPATGNFAEVIN
ncbi:MAG: hypothetical protein JEY79_17365 [Pseudodesulfovibrio sp.]|nr:hypothetical protein [Pseudodesulfovibrio sp.]